MEEVWQQRSTDQKCRLGCVLAGDCTKGMDTEDTKEEKLVKTCLKAQANERAIHRTAYTTHLTAQAKGKSTFVYGLV